MSALDRTELEASPLSDLHLIADQLGLDGYRRLRKADLIAGILGGQGADATSPQDVADNGPQVASTRSADPAAPAGDEAPRPPRARRGGRSRRARSTEPDTGTQADGEDDAASPAAPRARRSAQPRSARGGRDSREPREADAPRNPRPTRRGRDADATSEARAGREPRGARASSDAPADQVLSGQVELLGNGSAFLRLDSSGPSDGDVYISAAQVRRCELVAGDRVSGPVRPPRRSERYPSLVRVDTINSAPADAVAEGTHYDDLPATWPSERFALDEDDPTLEAVARLTPLGRGSRVVICGGARAGKTEALRRLVTALAAQPQLDLSLVLAGIRPEEIGEWQSDAVKPLSALTMAASPDAQTAAVERAVETARRVAARGGHAVVAVDSLDALTAHAARKVLAAARNITDGGSLTVIATATTPVGGETTVIALDAALTALGKLPALDLHASGTMRPDLLVGESGVAAIAEARAAT